MQTDPAAGPPNPLPDPYSARRFGGLFVFLPAAGTASLAFRLWQAGPVRPLRVSQMFWKYRYSTKEKPESERAPRILKAGRIASFSVSTQKPTCRTWSCGRWAFLLNGSETPAKQMAWRHSGKQKRALKRQSRIKAHIPVCQRVHAAAARMLSFSVTRGKPWLPPVFLPGRPELLRRPAPNLCRGSSAGSSPPAGTARSSAEWI